jgi:hypothetical protein
MSTSLEEKLSSSSGTKGRARATLEQLSLRWGCDDIHPGADSITVRPMGGGPAETWIRIAGRGKAALFEQAQ